MIPLSRATVTDEMKRAMLAVVDSGRFILGPQTRAFEEEFARYVGTAHAVAVSQGTSAIQLAILAFGIRPGDEVLVPSMTAFPTIEGVVHAGATPVFVDCDTHGCIDPEAAEAAITARTVGIVAVHLYGGPADLDGLVALAGRRNLWLLEDCAQSHGATHRGRMTGSIGRAGTFSFYPSKNLTVFGDGGMVVTHDAEVAKTVRLLRDHGRTDKYTHVAVGFNLRFNDVQAAVGRVQLKELETYVARRRSIAARYDAAFRALPGVRVPQERPQTRRSFHLYPLRLKDQATRDALAKSLEAGGIETGVHYPIPNHRQPAMAYLGTPPALPESDAFAHTELSLPMFPGLPDADVQAVISAVSGFFSNRP